MCLSAPVSFATGGGLAAIGGGAIRRAKRGLRWIAVIPVIFAAQQTIEGVLWVVGTSHPASVALGYAFLAAAFVFWPAYIPFMLLRNERHRTRRRLLRTLLALGMAVSVYLAIGLVRLPLAVEAIGRSIHYAIDMPAGMLITVMYVLVVLSSFAVSSIRFMRWFGAALAVSALLAGYFFTITFVSVWCFFAAALSVLLYVYVVRQSRRTA